MCQCTRTRLSELSEFLNVLGMIFSFPMNLFFFLIGLVMLKTIAEDPKGPNDLCPRRNGFYAHPDPGVCNIFYACVEGVAEEYTCAPGLWFDEYQGVCNWPAATDRKNCNAGEGGTSE